LRLPWEVNTPRSIPQPVEIGDGYKHPPELLPGSIFGWPFWDIICRLV
jgi:hypothetical protein